MTPQNITSFPVGSILKIHYFIMEQSMLLRMRELGVYEGGSVTVLSTSPTTYIIKSGAARYILNSDIARKIYASKTGVI